MASKELDFGPRSYLLFLRGLARGIVPIEAALDRVGIVDMLQDWPARKRTDALQADLADFGEAIPDPVRAFALDDRPGAFGALYVLEGSRLGSQVLLRQALASDAPTVRHATRHLAHGQGQKFWPGFLERLDESRDAQDSPDGVIAGANRAFDFIHEAFTAPLSAYAEGELRVDAVSR